MHGAGGAAVVHGNVAYFRTDYNVYSYTLSQDKWAKLKQCEHTDFSMAVVNNQLTAIGGMRSDTATNNLLCLSRGFFITKWEELLPSMPTARAWSTAVTTTTHLIVAGGKTESFGGELSVVETLDTNTLQWSSVGSLPEALGYPNMILCNGQLYFPVHSTIFSCSVEELLKSRKPASTNSGDGDSVWTKLIDTPRPYYTSIATLRGQVLAIGGSYYRYGDLLHKDIHQYNRSTNSWSVIGEMPTPHANPLVAVLPSHELIVVGGITVVSLK